MKSADVFPSKYIAAADLRDREVTVVMAFVQQEEVGRDKDQCPVLYFAGKEKGLVVNRTNWTKIATLYGDESDNWVGKQIVLYPTETTNLRGETVPCVRVKSPKIEAAPKPKADPQAPMPIPNVKDKLDDEIPF